MSTGRRKGFLDKGQAVGGEGTDATPFLYNSVLVST